MPNNPSASHYQQRARGLCALCHEAVNDAIDRLHHRECDTLYTRGYRVGLIRQLTAAQRRYLSDLSVNSRTVGTAKATGREPSTKGAICPATDTL